MDYREFLKTKKIKSDYYGFDPELPINAYLKEWQETVLRWAIKRGRAALFLDTGLGKTIIQLEWARHVFEKTKKPVLILAPLAVSHQTKREADKFSIECDVNVCSIQDDVIDGINITNYEKIHKFDASKFSGVVIDESSILKSYTAKTKQLFIDLFQEFRYRLACTATPAPNDHLELGNHAEFLGVMQSNEMIARWFINDTQHFGNYRLKGHAIKDFWEWVSSWAACITKPSDLGFSDEGYDLPALNIGKTVIEADIFNNTDGKILRLPEMSTTSMHRELRKTAPFRAKEVAKIVNSSDETWLIWCYTNYEADELMNYVDGAIEIRGSHSDEIKKKRLLDFIDGKIRILVTKPKIAGHGLNLQHCHNTAFIGLSYSYEVWYQTIRRFWRFGQKNPVNCQLVLSITEMPLFDTVMRKQGKHDEMKENMRKYVTTDYMLKGDVKLKNKEQFNHVKNDDFTIYQGDSCEVSKTIDDNSIDFSIFSPPFSSLYIYSDSLRDMGNCQDDEEFFNHFDYLIPEMLRMTRPGRLCAVHCKNLVYYKNQRGSAGLRDFRGEIIQHFTKFGWDFHSEITIWKSPETEMQRTKAHGLLHRQLCSDSSFSRQGLPDYLVIFRKWSKEASQDELVSPVNLDGAERIRFDEYVGDEPPEILQKDDPRHYSIKVWQKYASPVWFDINQMDVLNVDQARKGKDEKHICPLQLGVIRRALHLWTNPGDVVFSPFAGIGSEGVVSLKEDRKFVGVELKKEYFDQMREYLFAAKKQLSLFDEIAGK